MRSAQVGQRGRPMTAEVAAPSVPVFDGHNDVLLRLWREKAGRAQAFLTPDGGGHLDLPRAAAGGFAGGMFAAFVPSKPRRRKPGLPGGWDDHSPGWIARVWRAQRDAQQR